VKKQGRRRDRKVGMSDLMKPADLSRVTVAASFDVVSHWFSASTPDPRPFHSHIAARVPEKDCEASLSLQLSFLYSMWPSHAK